MTGADTVSVLSWISFSVNLILIALIVFLCVMWIRTKKSSGTDKTESRENVKSQNHE